MFRTRTPETPPTLAMPEGYDDETSAFYVAPSLREGWAELAAAAPADDFTLLTRTMRVLAIHRWRQAHYPEMFQASTARKVTQASSWDPRTSGGPAASVEVVEVAPRYLTHLLHTAAQVVLEGHDQAQDIAMTQDGAPEWVDRHLTIYADELRDEAQHSIRLNHVRNVLAKRHADEARAEQTRRRFLCPTCGHSDEAQGVPTSRALAPESKLRIVSCLACYLVALDRLAERAAAKQCGEYPHMRTRAQIIDSYLDEKGL